MKKTNTILLICLITLVWLPVAYYYWIALPSLEREKFEYQKKLDQEAKDKKAQEEYDKWLDEENNKKNYRECITQADIQYNNELESVCEQSYKFCINSIDNWNSTMWKYDGMKNYSECDEHKYKDWWCTFYVNLNEYRETKHKEALDRCEKMYN